MTRLKRFFKFLGLRYGSYRYSNPYLEDSYPKFRWWVWKKLLNGDFRGFAWWFLLEERDAWYLSK